MLLLLKALSLKVFSFVLVGAVLGFLIRHRGEKTIQRFIWLALNVLIPVFIFVSLWSSNVPVRTSLGVVLTASIVLAAGFVFAWFWAKARHIHFRDQSLPIIIMNSAYLALPVCKFIGGEEAFNYALVYNVVAMLVNFTFGIIAITRGNALSEIFDMPIIYAVAAGLALNIAAVQVPAVVLKSNSLLSFVVLPAMLMLVGYRIAKIRLHSVKAAAYGVLLRMGGGFIVAFLCVKLFNLTGAAGLVCILSSTMPAAVNTYILAEYYKLDTDFAASTVVIGTALSFFVIPLIYFFYK